MNLEFIESERYLDARSAAIAVLRQVVEILEATETNNESAALVLDRAHSYDTAIKFLKQVETITHHFVIQVGLRVRLEAHERGLINANAPAQEPPPKEGA